VVYVSLLSLSTISFGTDLGTEKCMVCFIEFELGRYRDLAHGTKDGRAYREMVMTLHTDKTGGSNEGIHGDEGDCQTDRQILSDGLYGSGGWYSVRLLV
jgi:hypothetical protein